MLNIPDGGGSVTARETGYLQRIALLRHKINLALDSITGMIQCRPAEPDGPDDFERRKTRINEFLSRFSRNYLFQFQRQVNFFFLTIAMVPNKNICDNTSTYTAGIPFIIISI